MQIWVVQAPEYDDAILSTVEEDDTHSRPLIIGNRGVVVADNRSWLFYISGGSWLIWTSSIDGETWETPYVIGQHPHFSLAYDEPRNILHLAYAGLYGDLYYRRGHPNGTLGLITWNSTAVVDSAVSSCEYLSIDYDSNGYTYLSYNNGSSSSQPYIDANSDNTTGAWIGASGFPYQLNSTGTWLARTLLSVLDNDNVLVVYRAQSTPPVHSLYSRLYCANNSTWNAQTQASNWTCQGTIGYSLVTVGNDTYVMYDAFESGAGGGDLNNRMTIHNYTTLSWSMEAETPVLGHNNMEICYDWLNERIYLFAFGYLDDSMLNITYLELSNQTWMPQEEIEEYITLSLNHMSGTAYVDQYGRMGFAWATTTYPPHDIRFGWFEYIPIVPPPPPDEHIPMPDLVSMYVHLGLCLLGLLMMFFALIWLAWGIKKKGINEVTIERGGYSMLIFIVGFGLLMTQLFFGA